MEGDGICLVRSVYRWNFNPLPPHGGRPDALRLCRRKIRYFNPLPPHGGRRGRSTTGARRTDFNPLPPHGGRLRCVGQNYGYVPFQSTPSAWRETPVLHPSDRGNTFQSTPSAWRETNIIIINRRSIRRFQSTPSAWRETTAADLDRWEGKDFNPLPPHGGRPIIESWKARRVHFNPLPPHGGRPARKQA